MKFTLQPPAKITLHLAVEKRRPDGFHGLESIFAALDFADTLNLSLLPGNDKITTLTVKEEGPLQELIRKGQHFPPLPAEKNIVYLAVELFRLKTGFSPNLSVELIKRIPPGSGLGGGSSDAASTLLALNELYGSSGITGENSGKLSGEELLDMALQLGSDVPFFAEIALQNMKKSSVRAVNGRGEFFHYLPPLPALGVVLAFPGFASNTGAAYRLLDEKRPLVKEKSTDFHSKFNCLQASPECWDFSNDFEGLFINNGTEQEKSAYKTILKDLQQAGSAFSCLSGSGSACFGIFSSPKEAEKAQKKLSGAFYVLQSTFFLQYI